MNVERVREKVRDTIGPVINDLGLELYDLELKQMKGKALLRVFIDREEGITIDDCERVSREIEALLDVEDPIPCAYVLEVSSPGLDRPLKSAGDFKRTIGESVRVVTQEPIDKQSFFIGKLTRAGEDDIVLLLPESREVRIPYAKISRARREVEV